jgi:hypothetical protein
MIESNDRFIGNIKNVQFIHEISSMYDYTGIMPEKEEDHYNYKL